jgi:flagellar hook assembly protein FlgD
LQRVLTTVTLLGLLVATAAAFAITEHLKLIKSPVRGVLVSKFFSPTCACGQSKAAIRVKLRRRDSVTVTILDSGHHQVATLPPVRALVTPGQAVSFLWGGRTNAGTWAPDGDYYPEIDLADARHKYVLRNRIVLDTKTPHVLSATAGSHVLFVGRGQGVPIRYALSEPANAVVYLGGRQIIRGRPTRTEASVKWSGKLKDGRPVPAGTYVLSVGARDAAGNRTPPAARKNVTVVVRYIDLAPHVVSVRPGARFDVHVEMRAPRYTWRLGQRHGTRRGRLLRLRAPTTPGTYRLVVGEHGHAATAVVKVRAR